MSDTDDVGGYVERSSDHIIHDFGQLHSLVVGVCPTLKLDLVLSIMDKDG